MGPFQQPPRVLWAALLLMLSLVPPAFAKVIDRVVATVNDEVILLSQLDEAVNIFLHQLDKVQRRPDSEWEQRALQRRVLEELVDKTLIEAFAEKTGVEASEEEIDRAIEDVMTRAHIDRAQLEKAFQRDGIRYQEYRDQIRDQIIKAKLIQREIRSRIDIQDEQIQGYYLDHPEEFRTEQGMVLRHILFPLPNDPTPEQVEAARVKAERVRQEILAGLPFEEAARTYSQDQTAAQGGWLGFFRKGTLSPGMEKAVEGLPEGEVSEPVLTPLGVHLLTVQERTTGDLRPLDKVRDLIKEKLYEEAAERQFEAWRKELRKNANIEVFL